MGKTSQVKAVKPHSFWLPGFEPEGFVDDGVDMVPPVKTFMPTQVAMVSAAVVHAVMPNLPEPPAVKAEEVFAQAFELSQNNEVDNEEAQDQEHTPSSQDDEVILSDSDFDGDFEERARTWPAFDASRYSPPKTVNERIEKNLQAIEKMLALRADRSAATADDRHTLLAYSGWGGAARLFEESGGDSIMGQRNRLRGMVSEEEFRSARASVTSAFYTEPAIIESIWTMVRRLGFQGGRIVEPAAGNGLFLAHMPQDVASRSDITAVEVDSISAEMLECTFGSLGVNVVNAPIEKSGLTAGGFDLAISNVPFGEHKSLETRNVGYKDFSLHNYFIAKSIDLVRPGGLVVMITSSYTMDSQRKAHREWINSQAEMLGAYRLPSNAFKQLGGTEVVTDLLVFKKRAAPMFSGGNPWSEVVVPAQTLFAEIKGPYGGPVPVDTRALTINQWFQANPQAVIGKLEVTHGQYGRLSHTTKFDGNVDDIAKRLCTLAGELPDTVYSERQVQAVQMVRSLETVMATRDVKPGAFLVHEGRICVSKDAQEWIDVDDAYSGKTRERMLGLIALKEVARDLINVQVNSEDDIELKRHQGRLNMTYDAFVQKHGNVASTANVRVFRSDPDCPLILSLEAYNEELETFEKAAIFSKRTAGKKVPPARVDNVKDAMLISLGLYGRLRMSDMTQRLQKPVEEIKKELSEQELAFVDPENGQWVTADEYLSGHIRNKIAMAQASGKQFERNVHALTQVIPTDLGPGDVEVRLGAPWVPIDTIKTFINELVEPGPAEAQRLEVVYTPEASQWRISVGMKPQYYGKAALNTGKWGNPSRCAVELIEAALNQQPPTITMMVNDKSVVDKKATMAARERYETIKHEFKQWAFRDEARRDHLLRIYNDEFNQIVERKFDGSHLILQGMSPVITPYAHQLDAIWRIVSGGNTLLAHVVGAGKTFTMIAACMEMRRIGKANKPLIAVPNHLLEQFVGDCVRFYPTAKVLMATKEDLSGAKRHEFVARIATGEWDAVVMTHSTFERIPMSPQKTKDFVDQMLDQVRWAMSASKEEGSRSSQRTIKQCEKLIKAVEAKVERALNEDAKDDLVYFDQLGVDFLVVDEAHLFKNLMRISKMKSIAGLPNTSSNRAFDLWIKTSTIMQMRGGQEQGVVLASATPIANSIAETHVMQKYLQPNTLRARGLFEFDAWAATFGEAVQGMEISPDGGGYRLNTRFSRFVNIPDLMSIFRQVADIRTRSMIKLPTPEIKGGKPTVITCAASPELKDYTAELVKRAEDIRNGKVKPEEDNMLAITNEGRKAALDMRLIDPTLPFDPNGKVAKATENIVRVWKETSEVRGTQLVFCDLSTPKSKGFSVYTDLRQRLVDAGIPDAEIAFIHDYDSDTAKGLLFRNVRAGRIRVLMGSTQKMGMGTNVQKRLKAIWHMDAPWRPADVEQRDGRGLRAGNMHAEIELGRLVTEGSFDAYVWSLLETKARFIEQVMTASQGMRTVEDLSMGALSFAEIKAIASGNPLVLEKATVDAMVMRLSMKRNEWEESRWRLDRKMKNNVRDIAAMRKSMPTVLLNSEEVTQAFQAGLEFKPASGWSEKAMQFSDLESKLGTQIFIASRLRGKLSSCVVGSIAGFNLEIEEDFHGPVLALVSRRDRSLYYYIDRSGVTMYDSFGTGTLVVSKLKSLADLAARLEDQIKRLDEENESIVKQQQCPFEEEEQLRAAMLRQREIESELDLDKDQAGLEEATDSPTADSQNEAADEAVA